MITILVRTAIIYFLILLIMKFMGKREIGQLSLFDLVILLLIADISVMAIPEDKDAFITFCLASIVLSIIQKILAKLSLKIPFLRKLIDGKESLIIVNGKLNVKEMKKQSYSMDDLLVQTRLKNISSLSEVKHLILETNGEISIFKYQDSELLVNSSSSSDSSAITLKSSPIEPFPVIVSGKISLNNLSVLNKKEEEVIDDLSKRNLTVKDVYYAHYENGKLFILETF